jgi:hypothetical protein
LEEETTAAIWIGLEQAAKATATAPCPATAPRHELRGERRGEEGDGEDAAEDERQRTGRGRVTVWSRGGKERGEESQAAAWWGWREEWGWGLFIC